MKKTSLNELTEALKCLYIPKNRTYMIHSSLFSFGVIENGCAGVLQCLKNVLGQDATIIMPTFTFSFCTEKEWSYSQSQSETGALTEYFRRLEGTVRTLHPIHSTAVVGPEASSYSDCDNISSFGPNNPFEVLIQNNAINIGLGIGLIGGATFLHYAEELSNVPYRFMKAYPGQVFDQNGVLQDKNYKMFSRKIYTDYEYKNDWNNITRGLTESGLMPSIKLRGSPIFVMETRQCHDFALDNISRDPYFLATKAHQGVLN